MNTNNNNTTTPPPRHPQQRNYDRTTIDCDSLMGGLVRSMHGWQQQKGRIDTKRRMLWPILAVVEAGVGNSIGGIQSYTCGGMSEPGYLLFFLVGESWAGHSTADGLVCASDSSWWQKFLMVHY